MTSAPARSMPRRSSQALTPNGLVTLGHGEDHAVADACADLSPLVETDRELWDTQREATVAFRKARLKMGARLFAWRRRMPSDVLWGRVLRGLGLNRHTAHQAMRLAAEFCDEFGNIDASKLAAARIRGEGILRRTKAGQRALEAEPGRVKLMDLRRVMASNRRAERAAGSSVGANNRTHTGSGVDARRHRGTGSERAAPARAQTCPPGGEALESPPGGPLDGHPAPAFFGPSVATAPSDASAISGQAASSHRGTPRQASGEQLSLDFEGAVRRMVARANRVLQEAALDPDRFLGLDLDEGLGLVRRFEEWIAGAGVAGGAGVGVGGFGVGGGLS